MFCGVSRQCETMTEPGAASSRKCSQQRESICIFPNYRYFGSRGSPVAIAGRQPVVLNRQPPESVRGGPAGGKAKTWTTAVGKVG